MIVELSNRGSYAFAQLLIDRGNATEHVRNSSNGDPSLPGNFFNSGYVMPPLSVKSSVYVEPALSCNSALALSLAIILTSGGSGDRLASVVMNRFTKHCHEQSEGQEQLLEIGRQAAIGASYVRRLSRRRTAAPSCSSGNVNGKREHAGAVTWAGLRTTGGVIRGSNSGVQRKGAL